jgi:hypothetical protein
MANTNRTDVKIIASKEAVDFLYEKFENMNDGKYPNEKDTPHIADVFGADAKLFIDKIGSKWITIYDYMASSDTEFEVSFESAWYPPSDLLKEMHRQLITIDPDVIFTARYWDEAYDPIGVLKITDAGQYLTLETLPDELEEDFEGEFYYDDVIEPLFIKLEEKLNI